ncbi:hypothetical protein Ancab_018281 [Ancistrocladus abbreviatus]
MEGHQSSSNLIMWMITYVVVLSSYGRAVVRAADIASECQNSVQQVGACISYATGQDSAPSSKCCTSVQSLYNTQKECLCYLLEQAATNSPAFQSTGIQLDRLLKLPTACKLSNVNKTQCLDELHLTPSSPGASVFLSPTSSPTTPSSSTNSRSGTTTTPPNSGAFEQGTFGVQFLVMLVMAAFLCMFPVGL